MIAAKTRNWQVLNETSALSKLSGLDMALETLVSGGSIEVPHEPGRDVQIMPLRDLPPKKGLSTREGQARLVHDLASIELQAMELGLRTLAEFPDAPREFREELAEVTRQEGSHFGLCLRALDDLGMPWGSFPTHVMLWHSVAGDDSLLDRIVIVHRYLEGSGLDASDTILRRLSGVNAREALSAVSVIRRDEVGHVQFGSRWHHRLVGEAGGDFSDDLRDRLLRVFHRIPRRLEPINVPVRASAGFLEGEIAVLEELRGRWSKPEPVHQHV